MNSTLLASLVAANAAFSGLAGFQPRLAPVAAKDAVAGKAVAAPGVKAARYVRLSGNISLNGSAHVGNGSSSAFIHFNGSTRVEGDNGKITSDYFSINQSEHFWLNGPSSHVSGYVRPNVSVSLYKDGKYIGQGYVSGTIHVSGWNNNGWVNLSGSGQLTGDVSITD